MAAARQRFMDLVTEVRPELHRYCARMTGSVFDGEDVVQDTLAKAWYAQAEMESPPPLRPWLFRIAHNTAMDFLRRFEHRHADAAADLEIVADMVDARQRDEHAPDGERVEAALKVFAALPPVQRSALALKDVLALSREETATTIGTSVAAVKGALIRARMNVAAAGARGRRLGGRRAAIAVFRPTSSRTPAWFVRLEWRDDHLVHVRDFRYVPYIAGDATFTSSGPATLLVREKKEAP